MAKLFSKEKDIFLRIINCILILWLIIAIVITLGVGIKIVNKDTILTYEEYSKEVCMLDKIPEEEIDKASTKENCRLSYTSDKNYKEEMNKANNNNFLIGISNIVIVSIFIHLLNKNKRDQ